MPNHAQEAPQEVPRPTRRPNQRPPLTADQLVRGIFQIKPDDVKKILASKPGKKK